MNVKQAISPRLSVDLTGPKDPDECQACGGQYVLPGDCAYRGEFQRWQEHDDNDLPEPIIVVLCETCSDRLIEKHPRLYRQLQGFEPWPGSELICRGCVHRIGVSCRHPDLKANGGTGLHLTMPPPSVAFMDGTRGGRRAGWRETIYLAPGVTDCAGRVAIP